MSCNYADGLSPYHDKGQLGLEERFDNDGVISVKAVMLAKWIKKANHVVIHTGAGISTAAGIPDFRGPRGVWTMQAKGLKPDLSTDFNEALPTRTHMAIARLVETGKVKYVVSQNIDGLHLRSGVQRQFLSELHGNMFVEQCNACNRQFVRNKCVPTVGQKSLNKACPTIKPNGRSCRGRLHDTILDWEHSLPENDLAMADFHSCMADLSIALGTTMQIVPSGSLPLYTKKAGGKLVIINLQPTKHDTKADLLVHGYADEVMALLMKQLSMRIPKYSAKNDPTRLAFTSDRYFEWTISDAATAQMRRIYEAKCGSKEAKKRLEAIDDDDVPLLARLNAAHGSEKSSKKRRTDEVSPKKTRKDSNNDSDLEVVEEIPKKRGRPRKSTLPATPTLLVPPTKLVIKKNVTPSKTKYEIVPPTTRAERRPKPKPVLIVHEKDSSEPADLEMVCESDDDAPICFTTNFRRYLQDDKTFKREDKPDVDAALSASTSTAAATTAPAADVKEEEVKKEENGEKTVEPKGEDGTDGAVSGEAKPANEPAVPMDSIRDEPPVPEAGEGQSGATPSNEDSAATAEGEPVPDAAREPGGAREAEVAVAAEVPEAHGDVPIAPSSPLPGEMPADFGAVPANDAAQPDQPGELLDDGVGPVAAGNDGNNNSGNGEGFGAALPEEAVVDNVEEELGGEGHPEDCDAQQEGSVVTNDEKKAEESESKEETGSAGEIIPDLDPTSALTKEVSDEIANMTDFGLELSAKESEVEASQGEGTGTDSGIPDSGGSTSDYSAGNTSGEIIADNAVDNIVADIASDNVADNAGDNMVADLDLLCDSLPQ